MKRTHAYSPNNRARKVACTVSAAALMLGVSEAATVGLFFRVNYCGSPCYNGLPVATTAFGVASNGWENLLPMNTGYDGCNNPSGPYTLSQVIDTTTSTNGLNPLPNGSLSITWTADTANFSGFAGYGYAGAPPPSYGYSFGGGCPPNPLPNGEVGIYGSFMRDGVNFGPQSGNPPNVDITGLKSLFTKTPFAVELVASSDSMQYLTNAFIIDATSNIMQSVVYPNTPPVHDQGDQPWIRGHGGGLSTATDSFDTDHLKIMCNQAAHGGDKTAGTGYNFASTLTAAIITDKPVITMSPQQVLVLPGDTVVWSAYAVGVPPLSYQWRKNGIPIAGATDTSYGLTNLTVSDSGTYDVLVTNLYGKAISAPVTPDQIVLSRITNLVLDSNPQGPEHDGLNNGATWLASSTDGGNVTRTGVMSFSTNAPSQITVAGETNFDVPSFTMMFWMRSSGLADPNGNPATLWDRLSGTGNGNGAVVVQNPDGTVSFQIGSGTSLVGAMPTVANTLSNNRWHQVAAVYDQSAGQFTFYIDGQTDSSSSFPASGSIWQPGQELELGLSHDTNSWQAYTGLMDDVRFYNRALSSSEVTSAYGGALVDTNALVMQLNFTAAPGLGLALTWKAPNAVLQSADSVKGPFTDVPGAVSPYNVSVQQSAKYYRYQTQHTPAVVIANPYLM